MNWRTLVPIAAAIGVIAMACSNEAKSSPEAQVSAGRTSAGGGSGASGNASGFTFTHRAAPGEQLSSEYSWKACPQVTPDATATAGLTACNDICGAAHCVDAAYAGGPMAVIPDCPAKAGATPGKCIPDSIIELGGKFVWGKCTVSGGEGVCVPACLVPDAGAVWLSRGSCAAAELCTSCTDVFTGMMNAACADHCSGDFPTFRP